MEELQQENELLHEEVLVARRASRITAELVVEQFRKMEEVHRELQRQAMIERELRERLTEELTEADLRERELAEARHAADTANRAKSTFLANMSHELRTPLNAIIGYSELLEEEAEDVEELEEFIPDLHKIHAAGKHLLALINDVLDLSKIEAGKFELFPERFSVLEALSDLVATVQPLIDKNRNHVVVDCPPEIGPIYADLTRVRQCLFNLLSNASKFTEEGEITLTVSRTDEEMLLFEVRDSGIGMNEEQVSMLFQPFTQVDSSSTRRYGGTGLGLTITKRFCELMGGDISVSSEPGVGSTFTMTLPVEASSRLTPAADGVSTPRLSTPAPPKPPVESSGRPVVLAIDDDPNILAWMERSLEGLGVRLVTATSGQVGVELARQIQPAAVILDVVMPGMDGWSVLNQFKSDPTLSDVPVIMATILQDRNMGFALGVSDYLTKPIERERLLSVIRRYCPSGERAPVLVVEDDEATRETLRRALEREAWEVLEADNGRVGLERMAESTPSLILLDLMMPEMDGFEFVEKLRQDERWREIPVVVVTAKDLTRGDRDRLQATVQQVLRKGAYSRADLLRAVRRHIEKAP